MNEAVQGVWEFIKMLFGAILENWWIIAIIAAASIISAIIKAKR